jgi:hypothetical protein
MLTTRPSPPSQRASEQPHRRAAALPVRGIVRVLIAPLPRQQALCTCGWRGRRRLLCSFAVVDALLHAGRIGCHPAVPLVDVDVGQWP